MKRLSFVCSMLAVMAFAMFGAITLTGCSTGTNGTVKPVVLTPQQIASIACPQLNVLHDQFTALNSALQADPKTASVGNAGAAVLAKVDPINRAVCSGAIANPHVSLANLQDLINTGLPALGTLAKTLPMTPQQQLAVQSGLAVGETLVAMVNALQPAAVPVATSTVAAPAQAASAGRQ
jgi:hypothetical protein